MFAAGGFRGHVPRSFVFFFIVVVFVVVFERGHVSGMPAQAQSWQDNRPWYPDPASSSSSAQSALRFSPELLMAPSLKSSARSAGVLPRPHPLHHPPANPPPPRASQNTLDNRNDLNNDNNLNNHLDNRNSFLESNHNNDLNNILNNPNNLNNNPDNRNNMNNILESRNTMNRILNNHNHNHNHNNNNNNLNDYNHDLHSQDNHKGVPVPPKDLSEEYEQDLNGPEETWDHDPDLEDRQVPPTQTWPVRKIPADLPKDEVNVPPAVMDDDLNVDRFRGNLLGFPGEYGNEDLDLPELRLKARDQEPFRSASDGSRYIPVPYKPRPQGFSSTEHVGVEPQPDHPNIPMPDDVPVNPRQALPWQDLLARDLEVDKVIPPGASAASLQPDSHLPDASLPSWKNLVLEELEEKRPASARAEEGDRASLELQEGSSPFQDQDEENEVPEELVQQVVKAMNSPAFWRMPALGEEEEEEEGGMWESSGDGQVERDEEFMEYWGLPEREAPWNSLLLTLLFESVDDPEEILLYEDGEMEEEEEEEDKEEEGEEEEEEEEGIDAYEKELSIWQVLTNFPFPMLLHHSDDTMDPFNDDYIYDEEGDYEEYYDEDYDDDYEDDYEDDYDEEDYEDYEDNEEEEESDELDDYFYSEDYDECEDCSEDEEDGAAKPEIAVLSLSPMLT